MNVTILGGGSLRILPLIRGIFSAAPAVLQDGEIRLVDRDLPRAEAVGKLILAAPEYARTGCRVIWTDDLDSALPGTSVFYLTMGARRQPSYQEAFFPANRYGFIATDNLSVNGAFLSLRLGRTILNIARKMEKACPDALMLIFPNPVAVYSHLVNTHTRIRALGICGGFSNHRWDLTRLAGRDAYDPCWEVTAAGVNHLSFILRGSCGTRDLYKEILPEVLKKNWTPPAIPSAGNPETEARIQQSLNWLVRLYRRYGTLIFSTEADGLGHIFPDEFLLWQRKTYGTGGDFDPHAAEQREKEELQRNYRNLMEAASHPAGIDWSRKTGLFRKVETDITIPLFRALAGQGSVRITASRPNGGAVKGFGPEMPLEYTMDLDGTRITPAENLFIPEPFYGLIASLSEFQHLQSEAIAAWSPELFARALDAYPVQQFQGERDVFYRKMFEIFSDLDPEIVSAKTYFTQGSHRC